MFASPVIFVLNFDMDQYHSYNTCMGQEYLNYLYPTMKLCSQTNLTSYIFCWIGHISSLILQSNLIDCYMIWKCLKFIESHTEKGRILVGEEGYIARKQ